MANAVLFLEGEAYRLFSYVNQIDKNVSADIALLLKEGKFIEGKLNKLQLSVVKSAAMRGGIDLKQF